MRTPRGPVAIAVALLAVLAAGCGASTSTPTPTSASTSVSASPAPASTAPPGNPLAALTARQILTKAIADFKAASSVHVAGSERAAGQTFTMDLTVGANGCTGTVGLGGQGSVLLLRIGGTLWMKPDDQFWKSALVAAPADLSAVEGRYVRLSPKGPATSSFGAFCYLSQLAGQVSGGENQLVKGQTATIGGQLALELKDTRQAGSAYVTLSARPEFLQTGDTSGHVDFTDYNAPLALTAPSASQTVAGSKYGL
ncbi:MAG TPA: hypothetical protein VNO25_08360 [Streptosporangiaceae bacterium]|jgi:hypothetical protein|nr:hypothetical protein [Streptosporangiaceae bacterium]